MFRLYDFLEETAMSAARIGEYQSKSEMENAAWAYITDTDGECLLAYIKADEDGRYFRKNIVWL